MNLKFRTGTVTMPEIQNISFLQEYPAVGIQGRRGRMSNLNRISAEKSLPGVQVMA
jgi:hypothetical protein